MMFKIEPDTQWKLRGWTYGVRTNGTSWCSAKPYTPPCPEWYTGRAKVIAPSMLEGWSNKLLTARQV